MSATPSPRILAFAGSTRRGSHNQHLARLAAQAVGGAHCDGAILRIHHRVRLNAQERYDTWLRLAASTLKPGAWG